MALELAAGMVGMAQMVVVAVAEAAVITGGVGTETTYLLGIEAEIVVGGGEGAEEGGGALRQSKLLDVDADEDEDEEKQLPSGDLMLS